MTVQQLLTIVMDCAVIVLLTGLFVRTGKNTGRDRAKDSAAIQHLETSLKKTIADSTRASDELCGKLDATMQEFLRLLDRLDAKGKRLTAAISRAEELAAELDRRRCNPSIPDTDPYQKAASLIGNGAPEDEVHRLTGISHDEIRLVKRILHASRKSAS